MTFFGNFKLNNLSLADLGWSDFFAGQSPVQPSYQAARVTDVHRSQIDVLGPKGPLALIQSQTTGGYAVGDCIYHDGHCARKNAVGKNAPRMG